MNHSRRIKSRPRQPVTGLALVEVLVAVFIVAVALVGLLASVDTVSNGNNRLRETSIARWVAANKLAEARLQYRVNGQILNGESSGDVEMAQRRWHWRMMSLDTQIEKLKRVQVSVFASSDDDRDDGDKSPLITLVELQER